MAHSRPAVPRRGLPSGMMRQPRRRFNPAVGVPLLLSAAYAALVGLVDGAAFVGAALQAVRSPARAARGASSTPSEPWKPLVFKMPKKKPERVPPPGDDGYSKVMRERLRNLKLQEGDASEQRSVSETKVDDLVSVEAENAKINGLNAMWYMDRLTDQAYAEEQNPDMRVMRRKYGDALRKLDKPEVKEERTAEAEAPRKGFLELTNVQDIDDMFERARQQEQAAHAAPSEKAEEVAQAPAAAAGGDEGAEQDEEQEEDRIADYLEGIQKRSAMQDRVSRRVVKSQLERRQEYEESKLRIYAATATLGVAGSGAAAALYGTSEAFSFGLGSIGALMYLSGLSDYTDNAESPVGTALGGRRLLVPVILVLLVTQWYKVEALAPAVAELHLQPQLLPALLGFFMYSLGKVIGGAISNQKE